MTQQIEIDAGGPFEIFETCGGELGKGRLGVIMARAGVGKTACLVELSLDHLHRGRPVLHIALGQAVEHVQALYDTRLEIWATQRGLTLSEADHSAMLHSRMISAFTQANLHADRLEESINILGKHLKFVPAVVLIDNYDWSDHSNEENRQRLRSFKECVARLGAELWISAQIQQRRLTLVQPSTLPPPCGVCADLIDAAVLLVPSARPPVQRIASQDEEKITLLSGGAQGAEMEFGICAERWGLHEVTLTFEGRTPERTRGVLVLTEEELSQGAVSSVYLKTHMRRNFPSTPHFRKTLQSIWHQVNTAGEVFSVGVILPDKTVKGGTGWAAELGRHWNKPVHVFDQDSQRWFCWSNGDWAPELDPIITSSRFTGTGTRYLSDKGKRAIHELFERSFGSVP